MNTPIKGRKIIITLTDGNQVLGIVPNSPELPDDDYRDMKGNRLTNVVEWEYVS
jgi:hypothetical protein